MVWECREGILWEGQARSLEGLDLEDKDSVTKLSVRGTIFAGLCVHT